MLFRFGAFQAVRSEVVRRGALGEDSGVKAKAIGLQAETGGLIVRNRGSFF